MYYLIIVIITGLLQSYYDITINRIEPIRNSLRIRFIISYCSLVCISKFTERTFVHIHVHIYPENLQTISHCILYTKTCLIKVFPRNVVEWRTDNKLLNFFKLMHTKDATRISAMAAYLNIDFLKAYEI